MDLLYVLICSTGSSANWVPANFVASLRSIFRNSFNREIDQAVPGTLLRLPGGDKACEYLIDHDVSNWQVLLEVDGEGDNRVMLTCPLDPFICSSKNRVKAEDGFKMPGTFYTLPQAWKPPGDAIFGLVRAVHRPLVSHTNLTLLSALELLPFPVRLVALA